MAATDRTARHLELLIDTIAAVNSSLDLAEVFELIASKVADALDTDACFVYIYDELADTLELRATHGTRFDDPAHRPRMLQPASGLSAAVPPPPPSSPARQAHSAAR